MYRACKMEQGWSRVPKARLSIAACASESRDSQAGITRGNAFSKHMSLQHPPRSHVTRHDEATVGGTNDRGNCGFVSLGESLEALARPFDATDSTHTHAQGRRRLHVRQELLASRGPEVQSRPPPHLTDLVCQLHLYISAAFAFHLTLFSSLPSLSTHQLTTLLLHPFN